MELETWLAPPGDRIPNHPRFPVLAYRGVEAAASGASAARALFAAHGWGGSWVDSVFTFHHFHSTSHEVLAVVAGAATLELGGPQGRSFEVAAGDVLVLPAGTGHRRAAADSAFTVVGAYPAGQENYDLLRGDDPAEVAAARERIARLPAPDEDPVGGDGIRMWRSVQGPGANDLSAPAISSTSFRLPAATPGTRSEASSSDGSSSTPSLAENTCVANHARRSGTRCDAPLPESPGAVNRAGRWGGRFATGG